MSLSKYAGMAGTWSMDLTGNAPTAKYSFNLESTEESVFDPDYRSLADVNDYKDGGKYRSIVKLQMRYEKQDPSNSAWAMGTGWLISPDTLVTAGHNVYSWGGGEEGLGRAVHIRCYIGYHGRDFTNSPIVQRRYAKTIVTTAEWLTSKDNRHRDVAFIQVDRPFEGDLRPFSYKSTPWVGDDMLGVVGYPADKTLTDKDGREEKGALMYEMFKDIQYSLDDKRSNPLQMLKYRISTFGGQSGAPVIRKTGDQVVIGTHVYGNGDKNQASAIGQYGNDYDSLISVFTKKYPVTDTLEGINLVKLSPATHNGALPTTPEQPVLKAPPSPPASDNTADMFPNEEQLLVPTTSDDTVGMLPSEEQPPVLTTGDSTTERVLNGEQPEGFIDTFKKVAVVLSTVGQHALPLVSPFGGRLGGPLTAIAGTALGAMANACTESATDGTVSSLISTKEVAAGTMERAILAEASFQAVLNMEDNATNKKIRSDMENTYTNLAPNVKYIAPKLVPGLLNSASRINVMRNFRKQEEKCSRRPPPKPLTINGEESSIESNDFVDGMMQPTRPLEGEEAFFDSFGDMLQTAFQVGKPLLHETAKAGLAVLSNVLEESSTETESSIDSNEAEAAELLAKRAIMGEAALQAVMKLSKAELDQLYLVDDDGYTHEEGFFDFVKTTAQKIGTVIKDVTPFVVNTVVPVVIGALSKPATESAYTKPLLSAFQPTLRTKRSILSMVNDGTLQSPYEVAALQSRVEQSSTYSDAIQVLRSVDSNEDLPVFQEL
ncbi:trypsin-like serine protease [Xylaria telfairii]|nr:trypsin-like serine protease [Xylaria telfairii]